MTDEERDELVCEYLRYLEYGRLPAELPKSKAEADRLLDDVKHRAETNPFSDAWETLDELIDTDASEAWNILLNAVEACDERDLPLLACGPLETLIWRKHEEVADRFERQILQDRRFREAFTYVRMGGVPLVVQRRLNDALIRTGSDPSMLVEFDENVDDDI